MVLPAKVINVKPTSVSLEVSTKCPLNCVYCERSGKGDNLSEKDYQIITDAIKKSGSIKNVVYCGIGESFMNPLFYQMAGSKDISGISIISSGMLPIDFEQINMDNKLLMVIFSIDAVTEESIKLICGENYRFDVLIDNLNRLKELTRKNKKIMSLLNCTINENNYTKLPEIMEFAHQHKFGIVHYSLPWGQEEFIAKHYSQICSNIDTARTLGKEYSIITDDPFHSYCCIQYDSILPFVNINGDVFPCGFGLHSNYSVGNIMESGFEKLWENDRYIRFRTGELCDRCFMIRMGRIQGGELFADIRK